MFLVGTRVPTLVKSLNMQAKNICCGVKYGPLVLFLECPKGYILGEHEFPKPPELGVGGGSLGVSIA